MNLEDESDVRVELVFRKPPEITDFELVKTFWISPTFSESDLEPKVEEDAPAPKASPLGRLQLRASGSDSGSSSCSEELHLPEEILNEPLVDDVFEEEDSEDVQTDLLFRQPKETQVELVYTLVQLEEQQLDEPATVSSEQEKKEDVSVDLLFREPTITSFELKYTIPLMEDVTLVSPEDVLEKIPTAEELDNVVEEADVAVTEFTFTPMKQSSGDEETLTTEVVTVLEAPSAQNEESKLTSGDTFDDVEDPKEDDAFQNTFVKSFETPSPGEEGPGDVVEYSNDDVVKQTLEDAAEKLRNDSAVPEVVEPSTPKAETEEVFEYKESSEDVKTDPSDDAAVEKESDDQLTQGEEDVVAESRQVIVSLAENEKVSETIPPPIEDLVQENLSEDVPRVEEEKEHLPADDVESKPFETQETPSEQEEATGATLVEDVEEATLVEDVEAEKTSDGLLGEADKAAEKLTEMAEEHLPVDESSIEEKEESGDELGDKETPESPKALEDVVEKLVDTDEGVVCPVEDREEERESSVLTDTHGSPEVVEGLVEETVERMVSMAEESLPVDSLGEKSEEEPEEAVEKLMEVTGESLPVLDVEQEGKEDVRESTPKTEDVEEVLNVPEEEPTTTEGVETETASLADVPLSVGGETFDKPEEEEEVMEPQTEVVDEKTSEEGLQSDDVSEKFMKIEDELVEAVSEEPVLEKDVVPEYSLQNEKEIGDVETEVSEDVGQLEEASPFTSEEHEFRRSKRPSPEELPKGEDVLFSEDVEENVAETTVSVEIIGIDPTGEVFDVSEAPENAFEEIKQDVFDDVREDVGEEKRVEDVSGDEDIQKAHEDDVEQPEQLETALEVTEVSEEPSAPEDDSELPKNPEDVTEPAVVEANAPEDTTKRDQKFDVPKIVETAAPDDVGPEFSEDVQKVILAAENSEVKTSEDVTDSPVPQQVDVSEDVAASNTSNLLDSGDVRDEDSQEIFEKTTMTAEKSAPQSDHEGHFTVAKEHSDYGNDYVPFGTEPADFKKTVEFRNPDEEEEEEEEEDVVAELHFQPIRQWKDEDVISLQSLKSLVAEVGCTTETEEKKSEKRSEEETLKILKVVPSEPSLMELDISNDPNIIHVPIPLLEASNQYLEEMVDWIVAEAVKEVGEREVVTESELSEMVPEVPVPEPLEDLKLPFEDDEKTPEPEEVPPPPQRPPRAPKQRDSPPKASKVRFGPLSIKLGRSYSEEQKTLEEMLEKPLEVVTSSLKTPEDVVDENGGLSPLSPSTLAEYEHIPVMDMCSVPHSPQEKVEEKPKEEKEDEVLETKILAAGKSVEDVGRSEDPRVEDEDGSECLDSIGDLSERTIQRFNTSIDDPSIRRDSFSSISSFGDRQKFRTAIENIRQDLLPFQSSVSQYLEPSANPSQQLLVANLSMDSPSDLSPNAPPVGFENTAQFLEKLQQQQAPASGEDRPSAEGSIDSSGFEKVDHEGLDDFVPPVVDPMQQSVFGSLPADHDDVARTPPTSPVTPFGKKHSDDGFVFIESNDFKMSSFHHDDVIEKNYFGEATGGVDVAKLLESPIAEEARKLVQDAVESASETTTKPKVDEADEIARELLDTVEHKVTEPVTDTLHKAYDGLGDFVHETVPKTVDDFVHHHSEEEKPESPKPKTPSPEPPVNIHETVNQVHDEIDSFLHRRDPTPPLEEADEDAHLPEIDDNKPHFGNQTPEEDETTFDRKGPLTIPEEVEKAAAAQKNDDFTEFEPLYSGGKGAAFESALGEALTEEEMFGHQKFETVPRPPTPPKDISDEDVKPSTVNLGPAHHHSHPSSPHHSILKHHGEPWVDFKTIPPCVLDVIYWRDAKKSAVVLSLALLALFILAKYPLLTVVTYSLLLALGAAAGFRVFKKVESQIKKTDAEHPFSEILAKDLSLPQEKVHAQADVFVEHATCIANTLKKLVFVESPLESLKFGLVLWSLTYIASWFSGFTLAILGLLGVFSVPKVYEANQEAIDPHLATISGHLKNVQNLIDEKLPFLRSAPVAAEEKKDQ